MNDHTAAPRHRARSPRPQIRRTETVAVRGIGTASPPHEWSQDGVLEVFARHFEQYRDPVVRRVFRNSGIDTRKLAVSASTFDPNCSIEQFHSLFRDAAPRLAADAAKRALAAACFEAQSVDFVVAATCTGYLCPGLSVHLTHSLGLGPDVQRADLVGMGCAGALPALQRGVDFVRSNPGRRALVVTAEVCSACWFVDDSLETVVGNAICADGAAAVVLEGAGPHTSSDDHRSPLPHVVDFETSIDTKWMHAVGLENRAGKYRITLSKELRHSAGPAVAGVVDSLLNRHGLARKDIQHWVCHAGGAAVLANIDEAMGFGASELAPTRAVFRRHGNMSSPTVVFVLDEFQRERRPAPGDLGIALALGPGLATEAALLRW